MQKKSKMLICILAVLLVSVPIVISVLAEEDLSNSSGNKIRQWLALRLNQIKRQFYAIARFFKGAENTMITGTVTARSGNILIVTDGSGNRFNIVLPRRWNVAQQIIPISDIDQYLTGEITVKTLSRKVTNENGVTVTMLIAHEISANGLTLYAVLPYNING